MRALSVLSGVAIGTWLVYIGIQQLRQTRRAAREEMFIRLGGRDLRSLPV